MGMLLRRGIGMLAQRGRRSLRSILVILGLAAAAVVVASTTLAGLTDQARADATCRGVVDKASEYGSSVEFFRAQPSTAGAVARWQEERHAPEVTGLVSPLRARDPGELVTICLFSGTFVTPHPPGLPDHDMLRLLVMADGSVILDSAGYRGVIDREAPAE
jgi:hypothetical protein